MYAMSATFVTRTGERKALVDALTRAGGIVGELAACHLYAVSESIDDETTVCVIELWDDKAAHNASLQDDRIRALIQEAMPLMASQPQAMEFNVLGGHGIERQ